MARTDIVIKQLNTNDYEINAVLHIQMFCSTALTRTVDPFHNFIKTKQEMYQYKTMSSVNTFRLCASRHSAISGQLTGSL